MGQAAGVCAARAALSDRLPHEVPWCEVKAALDVINGAVCVNTNITSIRRF
jgi:hypothetical protein